MKLSGKSLSVIIAAITGAIFAQWWRSQQKQSSTPKRTVQSPPAQPTMYVESKIVLPPEAFADTDTAGSYVVPSGYANGGIASHDDLTKITGISPQIQDMMIAKGISRFVHLAQADVETLREQLGLPDISDATIRTWISQAQEYVAE